MQEIFIIQSVFAIGVVLFEVPTGYFSDVVGRKKTLLLGSIIGTLWLALYSFSSWFWSFLFAELILWLGSSFISGTDSAMLYETLLDEWAEKENKRAQWYLQSISSISEWIASFLMISRGYKYHFPILCSARDEYTSNSTYLYAPRTRGRNINRATMMDFSKGCKRFSYTHSMSIKKFVGLSCFHEYLVHLLSLWLGSCNHTLNMFDFLFNILVLFGHSLRFHLFLLHFLLIDWRV